MIARKCIRTFSTIICAVVALTPAKQSLAQPVNDTCAGAISLNNLNSGALRKRF